MQLGRSCSWTRSHIRQFGGSSASFPPTAPLSLPYFSALKSKSLPAFHDWSNGLSWPLCRAVCWVSTLVGISLPTKHTPLDFTGVAVTFPLAEAEPVISLGVHLKGQRLHTDFRQYGGCSVLYRMCMKQRYFFHHRMTECIRAIAPWQPGPSFIES